MVIKTFILLGVVTLIVSPVFMFFWRMSLHQHHNKHYRGTCRQIEQFGVGSEDIEITSSGQAFITSGITFPAMSPKFEAFSKSKGLGRVVLFEMNKGTNDSYQPIELKVKIDEDSNFNRTSFRPHGLSVLEDKIKGEHLIYVINHKENDVDRIEKFRFLPKTKELKHLASFYSDLFTATNDLAVVSEDKFYVTNYLYYTHPILSKLETIYNPPFCSVVFHDGKDSTEVISNLITSNSVILSKDGRYLYLSIHLSGTVRVYEKKSNTDLRQIQEVALHTVVDNFHWSEDENSLLLGCHPDAGKLLSHLMDPEIRSPSQVLRLPLKNGLILEEEITEEFLDHGDLITGSTVSGCYQDKMIIGSLIDSLVMCHLPPNI